MPLVTYKDAGGEIIRFMEVDGVLYPYVEGADQETAIKAARDARARDDDVLLIAFPKSGTHWMWEILSMLHRGSADTIQEIKQMNMIEALSPEQLEALPSPRILNTHFRFDDISTDMKAKKTKIVLIHRNPKDVAVSHYNHNVNLTGVYKYNGTWKNWLPLFLDGNVDNGSWFEFVLHWEKVMSENPDYPIHLVYYEDLKENPVQEVEKLAKFLNLPVDSELCRRVAEKCEFSKMVKDKEGLEPEFWIKIWRDNQPGFYRKGEVGDWKNWFTVAQSEMFDAIYRERMAGSNLSFRFEL